MTATDSEVIEKYETTVIEDLDFELPCDLTETLPWWQGGGEVPCIRPAAWIMVIRAHHPSHTPIVTVLCCQHHYEYIVNGGRGWCGTAQAYYRIQDFIVRLEPLKPPATGATQ